MPAKEEEEVFHPNHPVLARPLSLFPAVLMVIINCHASGDAGSESANNNSEKAGCAVEKVRKKAEMVIIATAILSAAIIIIIIIIIIIVSPISSIISSSAVRPVNNRMVSRINSAETVLFLCDREKESACV